MTEATVVQKRGFYEITTPAGGKAKLTRVTTALDWTLKDGLGSMPWYGGKLFARWLGEPEGDADDLYVAWKGTEYAPDKQLRASAKRGTAAHGLFEKLLKGETVADVDEGALFFTGPDGFRYQAFGFDRGVVEAYLEVYHHDELGRDTDIQYTPKSEVRLWWTEHPIDECPAPDKKGYCTHGFSGTCDVYFPNWAIDDLKTHKTGYRFSEYGQMALYSLAAEQMYGADVTRQRIVLAHDTPGEDGKYYEVQDDRFLPPDAGWLIWELFKHRRDWGPKE